MTKKQIDNNYKLICDSIANNELKHGLDALATLVNAFPDSDAVLLLEQYGDTYQNLLKYTVQGFQDPERPKIYNKLMVSMLSLADKTRQKALLNCTELPVHQVKHALANAKGLQLHHAINKIDELAGMMKLEGISLEDSMNFDGQRKGIVKTIFERLWLTDAYNEEEEELLTVICHSSNFLWYEKCLSVSALSLSFIRYFDINKIYLLIDCIKTGNDKIRARALTGLLIGLYIYDSRLNLYPEVIKELQNLSSDSRLAESIEIILVQLIKAKETEKISKKIRDEIIPEVMKITPKLTEKLDLDGILGEDFTDDQNPEWENFFDESPGFFEKMEELSKMQMDGSDIFMSAFAFLKHFDFFKELNNWFLPFYSDNKILYDALAQEDKELNREKFLGAITKNSFFCNSDKYSFCLNMKQIHSSQKTMLINLFMLEAETLHEFDNEDEKLNKGLKYKSAYTQYIQDLYRFHKLYSQKQLFTDIFELDLDIWNSGFIKHLLKDNTTILRNIAELYFEKAYFEKAIDIYLKLSEDGQNNYEIYQKAGFCYQKLKDYKNALGFYLKADLFDKNKPWNIKKIAFCYLRLNQPEKALEYYLEAEKLKPDDLHIQANIGRCYLDMDNYDEALKFYFKVEYLAPSNNKVMRPIAWCSFLQGKFDTAKRYLEKVIEVEGNQHDNLLMGHIELCVGNIQSAVEEYLKSINHNNNTLDLFLKEFDNDKKYVIQFGVEELDLLIILDYLRYKTEKKN